MTFAWLTCPARIAALALILASAPATLAQPDFADFEGAVGNAPSSQPSGVAAGSSNVAPPAGNDSPELRLPSAEFGANQVNNPAPTSTDVVIESSGERPIVVEQVSKPDLQPLAATLSSRLAAATTARPAPCGANSRRDDEVWLVSSRACGCQPFGADGPRLQFWRYARHDGWIASNSADFFATARPEQPVMIAVHGNRMAQQEATSFGWAIYQQVARCALDQPPLRFVIWAWPSDKVPGKPVDDVRIKCARADVDSRFVAWFIDRLPSTAPLSLCGYSLGARVVGGALELTAGGLVNGRPLEISSGVRRPPARAVFVAAAIDNDWLLPGRRYGQVLGQLEHLTLLYNSSDRALRYYHRIYSRHSGPEALGFTGLAAPWLLGANRAKIDERDTASTVGARHDWKRYVYPLGGLIGRGLAFPVVTRPALAAISATPPGVGISATPPAAGEVDSSPGTSLAEPSPAASADVVSDGSR